MNRYLSVMEFFSWRQFFLGHLPVLEITSFFWTFDSFSSFVIGCLGRDTFFLKLCPFSQKLVCFSYSVTLLCCFSAGEWLPPWRRKHGVRQDVSDVQWERSGHRRHPSPMPRWTSCPSGLPEIWIFPLRR